MLPQLALHRWAEAFYVVAQTVVGGSSLHAFGPKSMLSMGPLRASHRGAPWLYLDPEMCNPQLACSPPFTQLT